MNVGILSMQQVHNYGSFLQAFSLMKQFEKRGDSVFFIDIIPGKRIVNTQMKDINYLSKLDKYIFKRIDHFFKARQMDKIHEADYRKYLKPSYNNPKEYDLAVIGSDEVFNFSTPSSWGFSRQLFGEINNSKKIVTYAASCGSSSYKDAEELGVIDDISECFQNIASFSVRDENTKAFVKRLTGKDAIINVDPVFLTDFNGYLPRKSWKRRYILVYAYSNRIESENEIKSIIQFAKMKKMDVICVGMYQKWCKYNLNADAFELLSYVKNADYIITDTFHGTVFSIKYNKPFCVIIRDSNRNKLGGLLKQFDLLNRCILDPTQMERIMDSPINWASINKYLENEIEKSMGYIDSVCGVDL